jgi:RimJ/RimL family protein N-acetyltransferase
MTTFDPAAFTPPLLVPVLKAGPVVLRPFEVEDLPMVRLAAVDPVIPSITSVPRGYDDDEGRAFIERQYRRAAEGDGFSFVIALQSEPSRGVGSIGLWLNDIESGRATIGYWVVKDARGDGVAGHALRGVVDFAFGQLAIPRLQLFIEPWNVASIKTATSAGFTREALLRAFERIDGEQHDAECYALLHEDWKPGSQP